MSARPTIYSGPLSMFGAKVQIAALEKGLDFDLVMVPYDSARGYDPKHPEVLRINPKRQVPVLTHGPVEIFDSTQIFEYLEDLAPTPPLWPRDPIARAIARNLEHQSDEVYFPHIIKSDGPAGCAGRRACGHRHRRREPLQRRDGEAAGIRSGSPVAIRLQTSLSTWPRCLASGRACR